MISKEEPIVENDVVRRFYPLELHFDRVIAFPAALTIRHRINASSPLHGMTREDWSDRRVRLMASVVGVDTVIQASVQSQQDYSWDDVRWGERFVEIQTTTGESQASVDYGRLHETERSE